MFDEPSNRLRRRSPIQVEPLEGRALLSAVTAAILPRQAQLVVRPSSPTTLPMRFLTSPVILSRYTGANITGVHLVTRGRLASAVVLGFSKPMAQSTVEDIHNFRILSRPEQTTHKGFLFSGGSVTTQIQSFPIAAAKYDPSISTVTLTLKRSARKSSLYEVSSAFPLKGHELTDTEGQPLATTSTNGYSIEHGFTNLIHPIYGVTPSPAGPLKTGYRTDSPASRLDPMRGFS